MKDNQSEGMKRFLVGLANVIRRYRPVVGLYRKWIEFENERTLRGLRSTFHDLKSFTDYIDGIASTKLEDYEMVLHRTKKRFLECLLHDANIHTSQYHKFEHSGWVSKTLRFFNKASGFPSLVSRVEYRLQWGAVFWTWGRAMGTPWIWPAKMGLHESRLSITILFNTLKGFKGYMFDYMADKALTLLYPQKYDVIISKGAINADNVNKKNDSIFSTWVQQLENLSAPSGHTIICPTFDRGYDDERPYRCKDIDAFPISFFARVLLDNGYKIEFIKDFNDDVFPFTFYRKFERE